MPFIFSYYINITGKPRTEPKCQHPARRVTCTFAIHKRDQRDIIK